MNKSHLIGALCAAIFSVITLPTQAALISVVYDDHSNIGWVTDANLALTNQFGLALSILERDNTANTVGSTGRMTWANAQAWITGMNTANYMGASDWRLPETQLIPDPSCLQPQGILFCTGSEMGHLYYEEGVTVSTPGPFSNVQDGSYWSSTEYAPDPNKVWRFRFLNGVQSEGNKINSSAIGFYAWAVRSGDVSAVPVPAAVWLFGSGVIGLVGIARKRKAT